MSNSRSPQVPDTWLNLSIGEIATFGRKPPSTLLDGNVEVSFVPMTCVEEESGRIHLSQVISANEGKRRSLTYFENGDVLFAKITPCMENGKVAVAKGLQNGAAFGSSEFYVLRPREETVLPEYLNFVLVDPSFRSEAARAMTGAVGQQRVPRRFIEEFKLGVPPLSEQREVIRILGEQFSHLDAAAVSIAAVRRKADQFRRSILHAAFSGGLTQHGACRMNPAEDQTSSIPDSWMMKTIGDVASYVRGVTYDKSLSRTSPAKGYTPLLRATNIDSGALILEDFVYVPEDIVKAEQLLKIGDLVIAASSGSSSVVGKSAPIVTDFSGTFGAFCAVLRADLAISNKYLGYYIQSHSVRELWSSLARGTNINNLKRDQVCSTPIAVPPRNEQDEIVRILEEQFSRQEAILTVADAADRKVAALRRSLFHAAFSGELTKLWREESYG